MLSFFHFGMRSQQTRAVAGNRRILQLFPFTLQYVLRLRPRDAQSWRIRALRDMKVSFSRSTFLQNFQNEEQNGS